MNDLDFFLMPRGGEIFESIAGSYGEVTSGGYNLEHMFFEIPTTGQYDLLVVQADTGIASPLGGQEYGLAWWGATDALLNSGDFNGDGRVDAEDLGQWVGDVGANAHSDADGDSDSDGMDFLAWQRGLGTGAAPLVASFETVPEPTTGLLLLVGLGFAIPLRSRR